MESLLNSEQEKRGREFKEFVAAEVEPFAECWDREQQHPPSIISAMGKRGYLGSTVPVRHGGKGWDCVTFGLLNEAFGYCSSALTDLITVQAMVSMILLKWGTDEQKKKWLPALATGETIAAFALTEPEAGSALESLETTFRSKEGYLVLNGTKQWISYGQLAHLFLVFGKLGEKSMACLVERGGNGVVIEPIREMLGFRAAGVARLVFNEVQVPPENVVGKEGFALSHIAPVGLHYGRISTACSALGLLRGCFEATISYATTRKIGKRNLGDIGMIRSLLARMGTGLEAARYLCHAACRAEDQHLPETFAKTLVAKYFTATAAAKAAADAVQIRGASGCHESSRVARYYRDAKLMEILEGTTQIHEHLLGKIFLDQAPKMNS